MGRNAQNLLTHQQNHRMSSCSRREKLTDASDVDSESEACSQQCLCGPDCKCTPNDDPSTHQCSCTRDGGSCPCCRAAAKSREMLRAVRVSISGMTCASCVATIESFLGAQAGVRSVTVALLAERAHVVIDAAVITEEELVAAVNDVGFTGRLVSSEPLAGSSSAGRLAVLA